MKIRTGLLVACLTFAGSIEPLQAETVINAPAPQSVTRARNLETVLRGSNLCKHYPNIVKTLSEDTVLVSTYADRSLSDKETKILALNIGKLMAANVNNVKEIKVRLYDPASIKYWRDIVLSAAQIQDGAKSGPNQDQVLDSIRILNNFGLVDGPNLESKVELYKRILKLQRAGINVQSYRAQLLKIETLEKNKQNIQSRLAQLDKSLTVADPKIDKAALNKAKINDKEPSLQDLQDAWKEACDKESKALRTVEETEQEQSDMALPEFSDEDAEDRYSSLYQGLQKKINTAMATWQEAHNARELAFKDLAKAKENQ